MPPLLTSRTCRRIIIGFTVLLGIAYVALDGSAPVGRGLFTMAGVDPVLYFDTAHSMLFDHDFNLNNEFSRIKPDSPRKIMPISGLPASCYAIGYSLLEVPFLAAGTVVDRVTGNAADGYSGYALYFYCIANVVLTGLGLLYLFNMLVEADPSFSFADSSLGGQPGNALMVVFAIFFGTTVGTYAFTRMAHTATFLFASAFMFCWWRARDSSAAGKWLLVGLVGGFLSICRWQDAIFLGAPILYDLLGGEPWRHPLQWVRARAAYAVGVFICWIPQFIEWKAIFGKYLAYPYSPAYFVDHSYEIDLMKFSFPPPYLWNVLTSSHNGWFVWTPLVALGAAGLLYGTAKQFRLFAPWLAVVAIEVFLIGSVNGWSGTDGFGNRLLMSTLPIIALGLFALLSAAGARSGMRGLLVAAMVFCCVFSFLFAIQYRLKLIPKGTTLTASEVFSDKLHLMRVRRQKQAAQQGAMLLEADDFNSAIPILEAAAARGEDRDVLQTLSEAYRAKGDLRHAEEVDLRRKRYLDSSLN
jgi:hypothetical protein